MKQVLIYITLCLLSIGCNPSGKPAYKIPEPDSNTKIITYEKEAPKDVPQNDLLDTTDASNEVKLEESSSNNDSSIDKEDVPTATEDAEEIKSEDLVRRVLYIAPDSEADLLTIDMIKSEITQVNSYFRRFKVVDVAIDVLLETIGNTDIDYVIRESEVYSAELYLEVKRIAEANSEVLSLRLYCVQSRELIASHTQLLSGKASTTDQNRIIQNVAIKGFEKIVDTFSQNVEGTDICPPANYSER